MKYRRLPAVALTLSLFLCLSSSLHAQPPIPTSADTSPIISSQVLSLDGPDWLVAIDPENLGRNADWFAQPQPQAQPARVPGIIQDSFPAYHGVVWYWRTFDAPSNPHQNGRYLLRFWGVSYYYNATSLASDIVWSFSG